MLSLAWAKRYLQSPTPLAGGAIYFPLQQLISSTPMRVSSFQASGERAARDYRLVYAARPASLWPIVHIHDSLDEPVWIFERTP